MSLIYGLFNPKESCSIDNELEQLYFGIKHLPHEKNRLKKVGQVGFGQALTYNTQESLFEKMPVYVSEKRLLFVSQGRIDNRRELSGELGIVTNNKLSDGELILQSYIKWGETCVHHLLGDWSFACFNFDTEELYIARDHHGYTALFYHYKDEQFSFGTSIKSLLALAKINQVANKSYIIHSLAIWEQDKDDNESIYNGIYLLPPAHTLKLKNGKLKVERYWFPEEIPIIKRKNTQEYAEELREILSEAVKVRLRSYKPVASMLSGGLDSGTVSFLAAEIMQKQGMRLKTFSHVPLFKNELSQIEELNKVFDEGPFIEATAQASNNIETCMLDSEDFSIMDGILQVIEYQDNIVHAAGNAYWLADIMETTKKQGYGTLLTGENGNAGISYTGVNYLLPINHPSFLANPKRMIKSRILKPLILKYFPQIFNLKSGGLEKYIQYVSYLNQGLVKEWDVLGDIRRNNKGFSPLFTNSKEGMLKILAPGQNARCQFGGNTSYYYGVEKRDPTADKRVLEYCLSIPNDAFFNKNGDSKQVLKQMMKHRLPDKVLFENKKGLQSSDIIFRSLADQKRIGEYIDLVCENNTFNEMVHTERLRQDWKTFVQSKNNNVLQIQTILKTLMVGCFLEKNKL